VQGSAGGTGAGWECQTTKGKQGAAAII